MAAVEFKNFEEFQTLQGKQLPLGEWVLVTQEMINAFAVATRDDQWIHTDGERAEKESPFGRTIAHGFMSLALVSAMIGDLVKFNSMKMGVNYGLNRVRFPSPVLVNSRLRLHCRIETIEKIDNNGLKVTWDCLVEIENSEKPACVCELIAMVFE